MTEAKLQLVEQFARTAKLFHRYKLRNWCNRTSIADTSRGQGRVLALLNIQPEMSQKELGYLLGIRNQSISELVAKLEKAGYVTKEPSESDKRVMNVKLTEKGKEIAARSKEQTADFTDVFDCLSQEEQATLSEYLDRINAELEKELGVDDTFPTEWQDASPEDLREMFSKFHEQGEACGFGGFVVGRGGSKMHDGEDARSQMFRGFGRDPHDFDGPAGGGRHHGRPHGRHPASSPGTTPSEAESDQDDQGKRD